MITSVGAGASATVRSYVPRDRDREQVLELIAGDRLPGRPAVTASMLGDVLAGCCPGDVAASLLEEPRTDVAVDRSGKVVGVIGWAVRAQGGEGLLLWLHCVEDDQMIAGVLIRHMLEQAGRRTVHGIRGTHGDLVRGPAGAQSRRGAAVALEAVDSPARTAGATSTNASTHCGAPAV